MQKIRVKLEADKLRKLVKTEQYTTKEGEEVKRQIVEFDLVEMEERKFRAETDKFTVFKTHFACEPTSKNEDGTYPETVFIGDGVQFEWKNDSTGQIGGNNEASDSINPDDIPF